MKILFYNHQGKVSGAERVVLLILKSLDRRRFNPVMACPATDTMREETLKLGVECRTVDKFEARLTVRPDKLMRYFASFVQTCKQLRAAICAEKPDVVHANTVRSGLVATMATRGLQIPVIWHLHDEMGTHPLSTLIRIFVACFSRIHLMPVSHATGKSFRGRFLRLFGAHLHERVIHNGIELKDFKYDAENRRRIREELGLSDDELIFGIVGQITPRKGQLELLQTFAAVQKQISAKLLIVGAPVFNQDELYLEKLRQAVKDLGIEDRVQFLGSRRDVAAVMQSIDALVINSKSEALVLVAVEAMACRTPIIATDVGGTKEIITHGKNGWLVPFGDERALAEALVAIGKSPALRQQFAEESEKIVGTHLNVDCFINRIQEFYQQCVEREKTAIGNDLATQS